MSDYLKIKTETKDIFLDLIQGEMISSPIFWNVLHVYDETAFILGDGFTEDFIGSSELSGDAFVFNKDENFLIGFSLTVPERNALQKDVVEQWLFEERMLGLPVLKRKENFSVDSSTRFRHLTSDGKFLLCPNKDSSYFSINPKRVAIHHEVDLLFDDNEYFGFIVHNPIDKFIPLAQMTAEERQGKSCKYDKTLLIDNMRKYFMITSEDGFEKMENGDIEIKQNLLEIVASLGSEAKVSMPAYALRKQCATLLDVEYGIFI